jgi:electron transfer flavoprotein alpha subunit
MIIGVIEHDRGKLNDLSLQMLTLGRRLADQLNVPLHALLIGDAARPLAGTLAAYGAAVAHLAQDARLDEYVPEAWAQCVVELMGLASPQVVLAAGSDRGHEIMAHVAARTDLPLATNCIQVQPGDPYELTRLRWGGSLLEEAHLTGAVKLLTVAAHAVAAEEAPAASEPTVETFAPTLADRDFRVRVTGRVEPTKGGISLADARVVVGGGRGVGSAEGFSTLQELADLLGGTVGCSRVVTSLGWRPHSDQVGQTGTRIAPDVYIACGISGAIQHMVGCMNARCLVAINNDPEAPMVAEADYAIIGDLQQVVPALCDAIRAARQP